MRQLIDAFGFLAYTSLRINLPPNFENSPKFVQCLSGSFIAERLHSANNPSANVR